MGQYLAEGDKIVPELLQAGLPVQEVYATEAWAAAHEALLKGRRVTLVEEPVLKQLSALTTPNQALALVDMPAQMAPGSLKGTIAIALETIQDPGNLGTIIRIADWFGIPQVICSPDCVDVYNPKTIQATMGSIARVRIVEADIIPLLQNAGVSSYAATLNGRNIVEFSKLKEGIILIGNESRGLSDEVIAASTHSITIPRVGGAESLNAGIAAGIICGRLLI